MTPRWSPSGERGAAAPFTALGCLAILALTVGLLPAVQAGEPSAPENLTAAPGPPGKGLTLGWDPPSDDGGSTVTGYRVYRATESSSSYDWIDRVGEGMATGSLTVNGTANVSFETPMEWTPLVFLQPQLTDQTADDPAWVTTAENVSKTGFTVRFCEQETTNSCAADPPAPEVAWWALDPTVVDDADTFDWGTVSTGDSGWEPVSFDQDFQTPPVVLVNLQTHNGGQEALYAEARDVTTEGAEVRFCESNSENFCDGHDTETLAWFAVEPGNVTVNGTVIGEAGRTGVPGDNAGTTVNLGIEPDGSPSVFATTQTTGGSQDPSNPVVRNVGPNSFETSHCEYEQGTLGVDICDSHSPETNGWIAIDPARIPPTNWTDTGLDANETYHYEVSAVNADGEGPTSSSVAQMPLPPPPENLTATPGPNVSEIHLNWTPADGSIDGYRIYHARNSSNRSDAQLLADLTTTAFTHSGLAEGSLHHYWVGAYNEDHRHEVHVEQQAPHRPSPPTGLSAQAGVTNITLSWGPPEDTGGFNVTAYRIYRQNASTSESLVAEVGDVREYTDADLAENTTYSYRLSAVNDVGEGDKTAWIETETAAVPTPPRDPTASTGPGTGTISLSWQPPSDDRGHKIENYRIYRANSSEGPYEQVAQVGRAMATGTVTVGSTERVSFSTSMDSTPVVFVQPLMTDSTAENPAWVTTAEDVDKSGFTVRFCEQETDDGCWDDPPAPEVAWLAIDPALLDRTDGVEWGRVTTGYNTWERPSFDKNFDSPPVVLADLQTHNGGQEALYAEAREITSDGFHVRFCESEADDSCDDNHSDETVAWLALEPGKLTVNGTVIGEAGLVGGLDNHNRGSVDLTTDPGERPTVFATTQTQYGNENPSNPVVWDVSRSGFETSHCEYEQDDIGADFCDEHTDETNGWLAIDPAQIPLTYRTDTGLAANHSYHYKIAAVNSEGESRLSSAIEELAAPTAPKNVTANPGPGAGEINLSWDPPTTGAPAYRVYHNPDGADRSQATLIADLNRTSLIHEGLADGSTHYYWVQAYNAVGSQETDTKGQAPTLPEAPEAVNASAGPGASEITVNWEPPSDTGGIDVTAYRVYRQNASTSESLIAEVGDVHAYTDQDLAENTTYSYRVSAVNDVGEGNRSTPSNASTPGLPEPPENLETATGPGAGEITVDWDPPSDTGGIEVTGYRVYRENASTNESLVAELGDVSSYTDTGLANNTTYSYRVSAVNDVGEGNKTDGVAGQTATLPQAPRNPGASAGPGVGEITVTWDQPSDTGGIDVTAYRVYRQNASTSESLVAEVGDVREYTDTGLANNTTYSYRVSAVNDVGEGDKTGWVTASTPAPPDPPANLTVEPGPGVGEITVDWDPPVDDGGRDVTGYNVYRANDTAEESLVAELGTSTDHTDTGLPNNTTYSYRVSAVNDVGEGNKTAWVDGHTPHEPSAPQNLTSTVTADDEAITLSWDRPRDNGGITVGDYRVYRANSSEGPYEQLPGSIQGVAAGTVTVDGTAEVPFETPMNATPLVFVQPLMDPADTDEPSWVTTTENIDETGFTVRFCNQATTNDCESSPPAHEVAWWAIDPSQIEKGDSFDWGRVSTQDYGWETISFDQSFDEPPVVVANLQTHNGPADALYAEARDVTTNGAEVRFCEYQYDDQCDGHTSETVAWLAVEPGNVSMGGVRIGEAGHASGLGDDSRASVELSLDYVHSPFVFTTTQTENGWQDPSNAVVEAVSETGFDTFHCEYDDSAPDICDTHHEETNGWISIDDGRLPGARSVTDSDLVVNQTYHYKVEAVNPVGTGPASDPTEAFLVAAPENVSAETGPDVGEISLDWDRAAYEVSGYRVYHNANGSTREDAELLVDTNDTAYKHTGLSEGSLHRYWVAAYKNETENDRTVDARAPDRPGTPRNLTTQTGAKNVSLDWRPPSDDGGLNVTAYRVYRQNASTSETLVAETGDVSSYTDHGLANNTTYSYRVSAVNDVGEGNKTSWVEETTAALPAAPPNASATQGPGPIEIEIQWTEPSDTGRIDLNDYRIYRSTDETFGFHHVGDAPGTSWVDSGLDPNTTYHYEVRATNDLGEGPSSETVNATTLRTPNAPSNVSGVAGPGAGEATVSWQRPNQAVEAPLTEYRIYRANTSGGAYEHVGTKEVNRELDIVEGIVGGRVRMDSVARITFDEKMGTTPYVFAQTMRDSSTDEDPSWVTTVEEVNRTGFTVRFCQQEYQEDCYDEAPRHDVAWLAVDPSVAEKGIDWDWGTLTTKDSSWQSVDFVQGFSSTPIVLANLQTHNGGQKALYSEVRNVSTDGADIRYCESDGEEGCDTHTGEKLAWLAVEPGDASITGTLIGEAGRASGLANDDRSSVNLSANYLKSPLVFATTQTDNGGQDPSNAVIEDADGSGFETFHCEYEDGDTFALDFCDDHSPETNGWLALDPVRLNTEPTSSDRVLTWTDKGLATDETYHYRVAAVNGAGEGDNATSGAVWTPDRPGTPQVPEASPGPQPGTVRLDWQPPEYFGRVDVAYRVYQVDEETGNQTRLASLGNVTTYVADRNPNGTAYGEDTNRTYRVSTLNPVDEGQPSSTATGSTPDRPSAPRNLEAREGDRLGEIIVDWDPPAYDGHLEIDTYWVQRTAPDGSTTTIRKSGERTQHRDQFAPENRREYSYEVYAENAVGEGPLSGEDSTRAYPWATASYQLESTRDANRTFAQLLTEFANVTNTTAAPNVTNGTAANVTNGTAADNASAEPGSNTTATEREEPNATRSKCECRRRPD